MRAILIKQLKEHEGVRLMPYRCPAGKLTIGVGRNIEERGITEAEAEFMLNNDIDICLAELENNLPWFYQLHEKAQIVLVDMCYNMGMPRLLQFKKTLNYLADKDYASAAVEMLDSRWAKQVGARATHLSYQLKSLDK